MFIQENFLLNSSDGTQLCVHIQGHKEGVAPVLYLHGGPGSGLNLSIFRSYAGLHLEEFTTVVYLHQRGILGSGRPAPENQRLSGYIEDIRIVVDFICQRFDQPQVLLIGHCWGGFLGFAYLSQYEQKVAKFVALAPVVSFPMLQQELYKKVSQHYRKRSNPNCQKELCAIGPPPYADGEAFLRLQSLASDIYGDPTQHVNHDRLQADIDYPFELSRWAEDQNHIFQMLWPQLHQLNFMSCLSTLSTPLLILSGQADGIVPWTSLREPFRCYGSRFPEVIKRWVLFEKSSHFPYTEPDARNRFLAEMVDFLCSDRRSCDLL
jgi:pimeloyl-ACP methyl ester carboxylesterase